MDVSTSQPRISIIGLGLIGGSIGLALRQAGVASAVIGHDIAREIGAKAKKIGAVDQTHWNLISACDGADLIILSTPVGEMEETLQAIGPELKPGCVVLDTASVKGPVVAWAAENLPEGVHFVGGNPILSLPLGGLSGIAAARADLFQKGLFCLVPSPTADEDAIKLASDLASILGAKPLFLDPAEHDGLIAAIDHLPTLLALTLIETMSRQPAWRELRKVAGPAFETSTRLVTDSAAADSDLYLLNKENLTRWIDVLSASLGSLRQVLEQDDAEILAERFGEALEEREKWLADRMAGHWYEGPRTELPERVNLLDSFFGTFWRRKPREE